jgi:hypothetical protein
MFLMNWLFDKLGYIRKPKPAPWPFPAPKPKKKTVKIPQATTRKPRTPKK